MAKKKQMPAPKPEYVFPIPEANKILGNAYEWDGSNNKARIKSRMLESRDKDEMRSDQEQLKFASEDIRVGKEYLSGKRNAFNVRLTLNKKDSREIYQPMIEVNEERPPSIDTYDWTHSREDGPEWSGNFVSDVRSENSDIFADRSPVPSHLQMSQFRTYTKEENDAGLVWHKQTKDKKGYVTNIDFHKNVEEAYKQTSVKTPKTVKAPKTTKKPKEETGDYPQLSLF